MRFGKTLARHLKGGDILCLCGDLGTGKTTLTKGIAEGLKIDSKLLNSPSFVLMNEYKGKLSLYHFDLYRLEDVKEILGLGYEEFFYNDGVCAIEWAERLKRLMPKDFLKVELKCGKRNEREIKISAQGVRAKEILKELTL